MFSNIVKLSKQSDFINFMDALRLFNFTYDSDNEHATFHMVTLCMYQLASISMLIGKKMNTNFIFEVHEE